MKNFDFIPKKTTKNKAIAANNTNFEICNNKYTCAKRCGFIEDRKSVV